MKKRLLHYVILGIAPTLSATAFAQLSNKNDESSRIEEVSIIGTRNDLRKFAGSATLLDSEAIAKFDSSDLNDLITQAPGVYIRFEDGYGLRPNIGIRGVTSDRSQKLTVMEDGILITPAPYTAPAAYYFPNVNRMERLEIVKGPSAIRYGPHTVGGAINMVTPSVPEDLERSISLSAGSDNFQKLRATIGETGEQWGYSLDALRYSADGFKELDSGGDTGFVRNDLNLKLQWQSHTNARFNQSLVLKLGYADEVSDETYLGLTDTDFQQTPNRRYAASQLDEFVSDHAQIHAIHSIDVNEDIAVTTRVYSQIFNRAWRRFDGFLPTAVPTQAVLENPELFPTRFGLLTGDESSNGNPNLLLDITTNDRTYGSYGISSQVTYPLQWGNTSHEFEFGARFHHDYVERNHTVRGYFIEQSELVFDGVTNRTPKAVNEASSDAFALFVEDKISYDKLEVTLGLRYETIKGELDDALNNERRERSQSIVIPGLGVFYKLTPALGILGGINKGFSPAGPSSAETVDPEEAINVEYGVRYQQNTLEADVIGFYSDYSNLIGRCRASDFGCTVGDEFNGGEIKVSGVEATSRYMGSYGSVLLPVSLVYTYTESAFQSTFESGFSQWGRVDEGDELPYLPQNQLRLELGLETARWAWLLAIKYNDEMREVPGQGTPRDAESLNAYTTVDLSTAWEINDSVKLQLIAQNITDKQVIVARRPFGARPNQPRIFKAGVTYRF